MKVFYVYEHWRLDLDVCFYVGKGKSARAYERNRNDDWWEVVDGLEGNGSSYEIRIVADGLSEPEAYSLEKKRIKFWAAAGVSLTNQTLGGGGTSGFRHSKEQREARSNLWLSKFEGPEGELLREKRRENALGEKHPSSKLTEEQAIAIRADGKTVREIADTYGVSVRQVRRIKSGDRWGHLDTLLVPPALAHTGRKPKRVKELSDV